MDHTTAFVDNARDEVAARNRFESFKLGIGLPSNVAPKHKHARSHSRNTSISSSSISSSMSSLSFATSSKSTSHDLSSFSFPRADRPTSSPVADPAPASLPAPSTKRNSHHRRRSSVSTRRESAELMGMSLPDLPPSLSEDNVNLGDKDSIRRRALWALEGKPDVSFAKVEIPELSTPDVEKLMFDFTTKASAGSGSSYSNGLNSLMGSSKRDSFKLLATSSSSKDQLHTLVEEEEEEEEEEVDTSYPQNSLPSPAPSIEEIPVQEVAPVTPTPVVAVTKPTPSKPRPANLNLRPLSLTPENLITTIQGLPTPSLTPSPRSGLRSLSLNTMLPGDEATPSTTPASSRRNSMIISPTSAGRRPSLNLTVEQCESPSSVAPTEDCKAVRRSSISYKSSHGTTTSLAGLPTPEMTPTFARDRRFSTDSNRSSSSTGDDPTFFPSPPAAQFTRPLSTSEQHFLFKSHNALLARITDLERALSMRRMSSGGFSNPSRPMSMASASTEFESSSDLGSGPDDEMLRLIADLKAERDELKRDVDGWRTRVGDMEKQLGVFTKRVEAERRDAWVARSRVGLLEVEKGVLEKRLAGVDEMITALEGEKQTLESDKIALEQECQDKAKRVQDLEAELEAVKKELEEERNLRRQLEDTMVDQVAAAIARKRMPFTSMDSSSSVTDVELDSPDTSFKFGGFSLKVVQEEVDESDDEEEDNALAGYEDEDEEDEEVFGSSSSFDSMDSYPRSTGHLKLDTRTTPTSPMSDSSTVTLASRSSSPESAPAPPARPMHASRASLSKTWTFPKGAHPKTPSMEYIDDDTDHFFGCLEDVDGISSDGSAPTSPTAYSYERSKSLFASGFKYGADDDNAPFFVPSSAGIEVEEAKIDNRLASVAEEDEEEEEQSEVEDDSEMFGEAGGITITFTPPDEEESQDSVIESQIIISPVRKTDLPPVLPALNFGIEEEEEEETTPFNFGRPSVQCESSHRASSSPPMVSIPSSIPRPTSPRSSSPSSIPRVVNSRPTFSTSDVFTSTPPAKSAPLPSRVSPPSQFSPSSYVTPPTKRGGMTPSFIPQPVSSPSPMRTAVAPPRKSIPTSTFIPQPQRKPLISSGNIRGQNGTGVVNGSTFIPQPTAILNSPMNTRSLLRRSPNCSSATSHQTSEMKSVDLTHDSPTQRTYEHPHSQDSPISSAIPATSSFSSLMSSPLSARLSLQTFTNFIPMAWHPIANSAAGSAASMAASLCLNAGNEYDTDNKVSKPSRAMASESRVRGFVSRQKQLDKLRYRLETEGSLITRDVGIHCKKCDGALVML
ncbi:hypothetical protein BDQ12DRAFT_731347 [Crucibulum laeve]|uniref:Uncharacterized protein n=1 Tax=Crucibulum laeve TaxID=68775 RepID=A0A5C3MDC4_9AGAR|nr:hypothetical protein BDQ12DRAFT_731347 [Crucibulum laeve]